VKPQKPDPTIQAFVVGVGLLLVAVLVFGLARAQVVAELTRVRATLELQEAIHEAEVAKLRAQVDGTLDHFNDKKAAEESGADQVA